jgi:flagellar capping protein FliD
VGATQDSGGTLVRSSTNTVDNAITGLTLSVKSASADPVDVTVSSSNSSIEKNLQLFVDQYNKVKDKIDKETAFDSTKNTTGRLFGTSEVIRVEQSLSRLINQRVAGFGKVQSLSQLGLGLDDKGKLSLDKDKLNKTLTDNPSDAKAFLTTDKTGFGARAKSVLDGLSGETNSALVTRSKSLQKQIDNSTARVTTLSARLDKERERLTKQFYDLETNISKIKNNGSALNQLGLTLK